MPCLAASITSLFVTMQFPFIKTQQDRTDFTFHEVPLLSHVTEDANHS